MAPQSTYENPSDDDCSSSLDLANNNNNAFTTATPTLGQPTAAHSYVGSSGDSNISSSDSSHVTNNVMSIFKDNFITFMVSFNSKASRINSWKMGIVNCLLFSFLLYVTVAISSVSSTIHQESKSETILWGSTSAWIHRAMLYVVNLGVEHYPYELVLSLSTLFFVLESSCIGSMILFYIAKTKGLKSSQRMNSITGKLIFMLVVSSPFALWIHSIPIAPYMPFILGRNSSIYSISNSKNLYYFPDIEITSTLNLVFIVIGSVGIMLNIVINILGITLTTDTVPSNKWYAFFTADRTEPTTMLVFSNQISVIVTVILTPHMCVLSSSIKLLTSLVALIVMSTKPPFFRMWENSLAVGILASKTLGSVCPLIVSLVYDVSNYETVGGILTGGTIACQLIGLFAGFAVYHIYQVLICRSIRFFILNSMIDKRSDKIGAQLAYCYFEEKKTLKKLNFFIKVSIGERRNQSELGNFAVASRFVRSIGATRNMVDINVLLTLAIFSAFCSPLDDQISSTAHAIQMIQRAQKNTPSLIQKYLILLRQKEIEESMNNISSINIEMRNVLQSLEKKQHLLQYFHREFYKELLNEQPSIVKLENVNRTIAVIGAECDIKYKSMLLYNKNDKNLLRAYASYLETCKWEKELANELYEDANQIEEEETKKSQFQRKNLPPPPSSIRRKTTNRVVPLVSMSSTWEKKNQNELIESLDRNFDKQVEIDNWDSVSNAEELSKKEDLYRIAINSPDGHVFVKFCWIIFLILSLLVIPIIIASAITNLNVTAARASIQLHVCSYIRLSSSPNIILSQVRSVHLTTLYSNKELPIVLSLSKSLINQIVVNAKEVRDSSTSFMPEVIELFNEVRWVNTIPIKQDNDLVEISYKQVNTSISQFLDYVIVQGEALLYEFNDLEELNKTSSNYPFLYFYLGREEMSKAFNHFCVSFISNSIEEGKNSQNDFFIVSASTLGVYIVFSIVYLLVMRIEFLQLSKILRSVFIRIPKEESGKVFHRFNKKLFDEIHKENKSIFTSKALFFLFTLIFIGIVILSSTLIIIDFQHNSQRIMSSMLTMSSINTVISSVESVSFSLIELILRSPLKTQDWDSVRDEIMVDLGNGVSAWKELTVGGQINNFQQSIFGLLPAIDMIFEGTCPNISLSDMNQNSTSLMSDLQCSGLNSLMTNFYVHSSELTQDFYKSYRSKTLSSELFFKKIYLSGVVFFSKLVEFIVMYFNVTKELKVSMAAASSGVGIFLLFIVGFFTFSNLDSYFKEQQTLRGLLNHVNWETIEQYDDLKQFVISHKLRGFTIPALEKITSKLAPGFLNSSSIDGDDTIMSMTKSILLAAADGSIVCNSNGSIIIFNPAAEDIFGFKGSEVIGTNMSDLFSSNDQQKIGNLLKLMNQSLNAFSETFEAAGIRKNKTTFSVKLSMSVCIYMKKSIISCFVKDITPEKKQNALIAEEKKKSEDLLLNILPLPVANRLKQGETFIAEKFTDVTVFFSDMVGFTKMSSGMEPDQLVKMLNTIVNEFDKLTEKYAIDKIKTIGDAYFSVGGLHASKSSDHPEKMLRFSIDIFQFLNKFNQETNNKINIRVGLHTGGCIGGVIGSKKFAYDLWGDTINTASRMESTGVPGRIQLSRATYERVFDLDFQFEEREGIEVKGKGLMKTYLLHNKHHPVAFEEEK